MKLESMPGVSIEALDNRAEGNRIVLDVHVRVTNWYRLGLYQLRRAGLRWWQWPLVYVRLLAWSAKHRWRDMHSSAR